MNKILKVKDWINHKPQFEFIKKSGFSVVKRLSDGAIFEQGDGVSYENRFAIIKAFLDNNIHILIITQSKGMNTPDTIQCAIDELVQVPITNN